MPGFMPVHSKPDAPLTPQALASLSVQERVLLFCLASGTDWERAGVTHATAQQMRVRGLIDRASTSARFKLTPLGRYVLAALIKPPGELFPARARRVRSGRSECRQLSMVPPSRGVYCLPSGAIATGCGYVVWYLALRELLAAQAATVHLSMPALVALGGTVFLPEPLTVRLLTASAAMLGGIALVLGRAG
jgi:EamA-like transporter family